MTRTPNAQFNLASPDAISVRIATRVRRRMYGEFIDYFSPREGEAVLDVGVTSDRTYTSSNYFEALYPHKSCVTALGLDDARFLEEQYPGMRFVRGDARDMPFGDRAFDYVHCAAVLEHVGSANDQHKLIMECARVARLGMFLTTPNRWYPIEFHTQLPLLHFLPQSLYRPLYRMLGFGFFAEEANLNLVSERDVVGMVTGVSGWQFAMRSQRLLGFKSNILLLGKRIAENS